MKICPKCATQYADATGHCARDGEPLHYAPGTVVARKYEVLSVLGSGGMGVVYRARHTLLNQVRALKILRAVDPGAKQGLHELIDEVRIMALLENPHIVRVHDVEYIDDDHPVAVMEFVPGQDLSKRLKAAGQLPPDLALRFAAETCSALADAHAKGIVHRDVKPSNLLLAKDSQGREFVKVIDFGIAKIRGEAGLGFTGVLTGTTGMIVGTPYYASPEQAVGTPSSQLDGRTDIYSLGVVLYEMLTGRLPFQGDTPQAVLFQRVLVDPIPLNRARSDLTFPPALSALVMKALTKDREARFQTAAEMQRAIAALTIASAPKRLNPDPDKTVRTPREAETKWMTKVNPKDGLTYVWIPPSAAIKGFWLSQTPVTQTAYKRVTGKNPSHFKGDQFPVESVTWLEADAYCKAVGGRLPTVAEWDYAAGGGIAAKAYVNLEKRRWLYYVELEGRTRPVGEGSGNGYGLYDMFGNVAEWTADWVKGERKYKSLRGGNYFIYPENVCVSQGGSLGPDGRENDIGFRCVAE
jgi:hypothetical protein